MLIPSRYRFVFNVLDKFEPSEYLGSTWRGVLGSNLRSILCMMPADAKCVNCKIQQYCIYPLFYDRPLLSSEFTPDKMQDPPRPFVLESDNTNVKIYLPGDTISVNIVLFGNTTNWLPDVVIAFSKLQKISLGKHQTRIQLKEIWQQDNINQTNWHSILNDGRLQQHPSQAIAIPPLPSQA